MNKEYITKHRIYTFAGSIGALSWTAAFVFALIQNWGNWIDAVLPICLICVPLIIVSLLMLMMALLWYVGFEDDKVIYRNMFGIKKTYNNDELTLKVCRNEKRFSTFARVYHGDKKIVSISVFEQRLELLGRFKNRE